MSDPTRSDAATVLRGLIEGSMSRSEASAWAMKWVNADHHVPDRVFWETIIAIVGADMISTDRPWLYGANDFQAWLEELNAPI
jgi:transposase InsO family protein